MRLKLISDFSDFYDNSFDSSGYPFRRVTTDGPSRLEMVNLFKSAGIKTPHFGKLQDFKKWGYSDNDYVVQYTDLNKHRGEGKERVLFKNVNDKLYMMEYIGYNHLFDNEYYSKSKRILVIGDNTFQYQYKSHNDWRSNCGDVVISEPKRIMTPSWRYCIYYPLFAIDFVGESNDLKAVDFNVAPGVDGINLGKLISANEIVLSIKHWFGQVNNLFEYQYGVDK